MKSVNEFFNQNESRFEFDYYEGYGADAKGYHSAVHNHTARRILPGRINQHRSYSSYSSIKPGTVNGSFGLFDDNYHIYGMMVTPDYVYVYFDNLEVMRCETPVEMKQPLWFLIDLALEYGREAEADGIYDLTIDYIKIYQNPAYTLTGESSISQDIGSPAFAGSSSYDHTTGEFTINGSGVDIWGSSDQFHYLTLNGGLSGDGEIIARVTSQTNTHDWAKAGIMIRDGLAANAKTAYVVVTPSNRVSFQSRTATGSNATSTTVSGSTSKWVRLTRTGNSFAAYHSADGQTWTQIGTAITITMGNDIEIGLCLTSHDNTALGTAVIDNVVVTP